MSRIVHVDIEIDDRALLEKSLDESGAEWQKNGDDQIQVTSIDGKRPTNRVHIDLKKGSISHDSDYRQHRSFAEKIRQLYAKNKAVDQCIKKGHRVENEWVSTGVETDAALAEVQKGAYVIAASCT